MKKSIVVIAATVVVLISASFIMKASKAETKSVVVFNEVCSKNATAFIDEGYIGDDYIELYNTTDEQLCLEGWYVSDDPEDLDKHELPKIYLEPQGVLLLYANQGTKENELNFKISRDGEELFLSSPDGKVMDQIFVPKLDTDSVYARKNDGAEEWGVFCPTPGESNYEAVQAKTTTLFRPVFSHDSGFYEKEFVLEITCSKGSKIYYTTDGSVPNENSIKYEDGIRITENPESKLKLHEIKNVVADWKDYIPEERETFNAAVIRAIAIDNDNHISEVVTKTYFVGMEDYQNKNILSIVTDPELLVGEQGILITGKEYDDWYLSTDMSKDGVFETGWTENYELTNFWKHGRRSEISSNITLLESGKMFLDQQAGIRVQGNYTRLADKKSLQVVSRAVYSDSPLFRNPLFEDYQSHAFYVSAFPEKAYCMDLARGRNLGVQNAKPCEVFINGEHWYTAALMEKYDEQYFEQHYQVQAENVLMIKDTVATINEGHQIIYDELIEYLRDENISQEEKGNYLYQIVDVQSIIDWLCFNLYLGNDDVSYKKNSVLWRTIEPESGEYGDCKWRWLVYDIDHAAIGAAPESEEFSEFSIISDNRFYWGLSRLPQFRQQFVLTAMDMMNTVFRTDNVEKVLKEWGLDLSYSNNYFMKRPEYMMKSLRNEFELTGTVEEVLITVNDSQAGEVYINTIKADFEEEQWGGQYFTDYPITVTAVANPGYEFAGWSEGVESFDSSIVVQLNEGGCTLNAVFVKK